MYNYNTLVELLSIDSIDRFDSSHCYGTVTIVDRVGAFSAPLWLTLLVTKLHGTVDIRYEPVQPVAATLVCSDCGCHCLQLTATRLTALTRSRSVRLSRALRDWLAPWILRRISSLRLRTVPESRDSRDLTADKATWQPTPPTRFPSGCAKFKNS